MRIGTLDQRIEIQSASPTQSATGHTTKSWSTDATVWARIEPLTGREALIAQQIAASISHKITIRHYGGLTSAHRLKFGTRLFDVNVVRNLEEKNAIHEMLCTEAV